MKKVDTWGHIVQESVSLLESDCAYLHNCALRISFPSPTRTRNASAASGFR